MVSSVSTWTGAADIAGLPADLAHGESPQTCQNDAGGDQAITAISGDRAQADRHRSDQRRR